MPTTPLGAPDWPFKQQHSVQLIGAASSISFCAAAPHDICVSAGTRLHVFDGSSSAVKRQFTRFKDKAYGGSFRGDGKLIVAGGEDAVVQVRRMSAARLLLRFPQLHPRRPAALLCPLPLMQVLDSNSRTLLRQFKGHKAPVHVTHFSADQLGVLSGGDDGRLILWDITSGQQVGAMPLG